jgi:hypothetical protein
VSLTSCFSFSVRPPRVSTPKDIIEKGKWSGL